MNRPITSTEAKYHIAECRRLLTDADNRYVRNDKDTAYCIGALINAIEQLAVVVEDLSQRQQGPVIE